jgi:hypothetical protein
MTKRLGSGDYERADVEVKQSDIEARYLFLKTLKNKRSYWAYDLLGLFNFDKRLREFLDLDKIDYTIHFFLSYLLDKNPPNLEISPEIIDTPLINYYRFFFDKEKEIKRLESDTNTQQFAEFHDSIKRRNDALKKIIPNWKELKIRKDAEALCTSLQRWATEYNLNENWFLDLALGILRIFKSEFDFKLPIFVWTNTRPDEERSHRINYEWEIRDSISKAISDYWNDEVLRNKGLGFDDLGEFPEFEYRWRDFELPPSTWLVRVSSRRGFVEEMQDKLQEKVAYLSHFNQLWSYSNGVKLIHLLESKRKRIENYCDCIEQQKSENIDENVFPPIDFEAIGKFVWVPSKQIREQFVEGTLSELKIQIEKNQKALKSYESFTKKHFEAELRKYCNKIEKALPKNWEKTPQKYSEDKHFEWLIDFQVTPCKSYTQIAKENNVDLKTVREAINGLEKIVGITLRKAKHTGRPKGSKDSEQSVRKIGTYSP